MTSCPSVRAWTFHVQATVPGWSASSCGGLTTTARYSLPLYCGRRLSRSIATPAMFLNSSMETLVSTIGVAQKPIARFRRNARSGSGREGACAEPAAFCPDRRASGCGDATGMFCCLVIFSVPAGVIPTVNERLRATHTHRVRRPCGLQKQKPDSTDRRPPNVDSERIKPSTAPKVVLDCCFDGRPHTFTGLSSTYFC